MTNNQKRSLVFKRGLARREVGKQKPYHFEIGRQQAHIRLEGESLRLDKSGEIQSDRESGVKKIGFGPRTLHNLLSVYHWN